MELIELDGRLARLVPVWNGFTALVDETDAEEMMHFAWHVSKGYRTKYARSKIRDSAGRWLSVSMHRMIMKSPVGIEIDHINGNGLDNRRSNLRFATHSQNAAYSGLRITNQTSYKGVHFRSDRGYFRMTVRCGSERIRRNGFSNAEEAARAYDEEALRLFGDFAVLNFPKI